VLDFDEAAQEGHATARGGFVEIEGVTQPAPAPRFSRTPGVVSAPPALVGEHSREVLEEAGYGADEIARLEADGVTSVPGDAAVADHGPIG